MTTKTISTLHGENMKWMKELEFYDDELVIMHERIAEVTLKYSSKDILALIEHFQNQLVLQKENIDEIRHAIRDHEDYLEHRADENPVESAFRKVNDHPLLRDRMKSFEKVFADLRRELNQFLEKTF